MDFREFLQPQNLLALQFDNNWEYNFNERYVYQVLILMFLREQVGYVNEETDEELETRFHHLPASPLRNLLGRINVMMSRFSIGNDQDRRPRLTFIFNILLEGLYRRTYYELSNYRHESYLLHVLRCEGHLPVFINDRVAIFNAEELDYRYYIVYKVRSIAGATLRVTSIPMPRQWNSQSQKNDGSSNYLFHILSELIKSTESHESQENPYYQIYSSDEAPLIPCTFSLNSIFLPLKVIFRNRINMPNITSNQPWFYDLWEIVLFCSIHGESEETCSCKFLFSTYLEEGYLIQEYVSSNNDDEIIDYLFERCANIINFVICLIFNCIVKFFLHIYFCFFNNQ